MSTMDLKFPITELEGNKFQVSVDLELYAKETIIAACYKFSHLFYVHQQKMPSSNSIVNVIFESKEDKIISKETPKKFCNELIDQQIRYNTNLQFGKIRDMIVEEAFKPVTNK